MTMNKQSENKRLKARFFKDRSALYKGTRVVYEGNVYGDGHYTAGSIDVTVSTSATQNIGKVVTSNAEDTGETENADVGGNKIGNVTIFESTEEQHQVSRTTFDAFRDGKDIKFYEHFASPSFRPMVRVNSPIFYEDEESSKINHDLIVHEFGFGIFYKTVDEAGNYIAYQDYESVSPINILSGNFIGYPYTQKGNDSLGHYVNPMHPGRDGAIDVFDVRNSIPDASISDIQFKGARGDYQGGGIESNRAGSTILFDYFSINSNASKPYIDAQDVIFSNSDFPAVGVTGSSGRVKSLEGFVTLERSKLMPFNETYDPLSDSYSFASTQNYMQNFLSASRNSISNTGTRFKSATNGLIFGESNALGTDSIAFGGLKK